MEKSFQNLIETARSILILLPRDPYFDQVAAGLSLYLSLKNSKDISIACSTPMLVEFNRLVGVDKVQSEVGNKNLVVKFVDYPADNIEKVAYDVDSGQFRLTISPKPSLAAPQKEQVELVHSGISADMAILIGGLHDKHFPLLANPDLAGVKLAHVGIQELTMDREVLSFARGASSISEIVANLIKEIQNEFDQDVATNLLMGIHEGTRNFSHPEVSADTFLVAAELMKSGGKHIHKDRIERRNYPHGAIPLEKPSVEATKTPQSWLEPKIFKGTSIS